MKPRSYHVTVRRYYWSNGIGSDYLSQDSGRTITAYDAQDAATQALIKVKAEPIADKYEVIEVRPF
jgi:hypothetical protein